jgi:hypothetical protein
LSVIYFEPVRSAVMRALCFVVFTVTAFVLSALSSGAAPVADHAAVKVVPPQCSTNPPLRTAQRRGFTVFCGPGSAVVWSKGVWHTIKGSGCTDGRLAFGVWSQRRTPHEGLYIVLDSLRAGTVDMIDGGIELIPGTRTALSGTANVEPGLTRGTFNVYGPNGSGADGSRFIGAWNCG